MSCVFCDIIARKAPAEIIYEDDEVIAFYGLKFKAPVHILVMPKVHINNIMGLQPEHQTILLKCYVTFQHLAKHYGVDESGFRIIANTGKEGQQEINHFFYHLVGGRQLKWEF